MGAGEEPIRAERIVLQDEKTAHYSEGKRNLPRLLHRRTALLLTVILLLGTITMALAAVLIIARTTRFQSCNLNIVGKTDIASSILPAVADTKKVELFDPCPDDWVWYRRKCYYFSEEDKTWADSLEFCKLHNASLVIIESRKELTFLFRRKGSEADHWIGLKSTEDNTGWSWVNGTLYTGEIFPKPNFSSETQYVYLNKKEVKTQPKIYENHWICSKSPLVCRT